MREKTSNFIKLLAAVGVFGLCAGAIVAPWIYIKELNDFANQGERFTREHGDALEERVEKLEGFARDKWR